MSEREWNLRELDRRGKGQKYVDDVFMPAMLEEIHKARLEVMDICARMATEMWLEARGNVHHYSGNVAAEIRAGMGLLTERHKNRATGEGE